MRKGNIRPRDRNRGIQNIQSIISLLDNSDKFKNQLREMGSLSAELDAKIAAWGKIETIDAILEKANETKLKAEQKLQKAHESAAAMLTEADVTIKEEKRALSKRVKGQTKRESDVAKSLQEQDRRESAIQLDKTTLAAREARCVKREQVAAEAKLTVEQTLNRIKEAALG